MLKLNGKKLRKKLENRKRLVEEQEEKEDQEGEQDISPEYSSQ